MRSVSSSRSNFSKYERMGIYHWRQTDPAWRNTGYNAPLVARYSVLLQHIPATAKMILDVGCGDGYLLHLLYNNGFDRAVGIDSDQLAVKLAKEQLRKYNNTDVCQVSLCSVYKLPYFTPTFDTVVMADVIEHLEEPRDALKEATRVLRESGHLVLSTPNSQPDRVWDKSHIQEFSLEELQNILVPFFREVVLFACWPMWCFKLWEFDGRWKKLVNLFARLGFNPFSISTKRVSSEYGQLIAVCCK